MKTTTHTEMISAAPPSALRRCASVAWQTSRRVGVLCWAIGVAIMNLGE